MKKSLCVVLALFLASSGFAKAVNGGFYHVGFQGYINPQTELNTRLSNLGYSGLDTTGYGMTWGGGGFYNNFFVGGWGTMDFNSSTSANDGVKRTLSGGTGGRGGIEVGYVVLNSDTFKLIPSLNMLWGGYGYTFATNVSFDSWIQNPKDWAPSFGISDTSVGIALNALLMKDQGHAGLMIKVVYLYSLNSTMGHPVFSGAPAINHHSFLFSIESAFGSLSDDKKFRSRKVLQAQD